MCKLRTATLALTALLCIDPCHADHFFPAGSTTVLGGKVVSINGSRILFDLSCNGDARNFSFQDGVAVHFNDKCTGKQIEAFGGDPTECPDDRDGNPSSIGAKKFYSLVTKDRKDYALRSVRFFEDQLTGELLISGSGILLKRNSLDALSYIYDCSFKNYKYK